MIGSAGLGAINRMLTFPHDPMRPVGGMAQKLPKRERLA